MYNQSYTLLYTIGLIILGTDAFNISMSFVGYMQVNTAAALDGMFVSMSTPSFDVNFTSCLTFDYNIDASEETVNHTNTPGLQIYIRSKDYMLSGQLLWNSIGLQKGTANVSLWDDQMHGVSKLDFVALIGDPLTTTIDISNVKFRNGICQNTSEVECRTSQFRCRDRQECITMDAVCNGTSECADSSDEEPPICGEL